MEYKHSGNRMRSLLGGLMTTLLLSACGTSPVGNNQGGSGGGGSIANVDGSAAPGDATSDQGSVQDIAGSGSGGAGGSADPCADCKTLDRCCQLVSLDGCRSSGACIAASGSQQQMLAAHCRTDLDSFVITLPGPAMSCGAGGGTGSGNTSDGGAPAAGDGGPSETGAACPTQPPNPTFPGGTLVYQSCANADQVCNYSAQFCQCEHTDAVNTLVWVCKPTL